MSRTNRIVLDHAHWDSDTGAGEGVKVARLRHGEEADDDNTGFCCFRVMSAAFLLLGLLRRENGTDPSWPF